MLWPKRKEVAHRKKKNGFMLSCNDKIRIKTRFDNLTRIGREWGMTQRYIDLLTRHKVKLLCIRDRLLFDENGATPILTIKNAECPL